MKEVSEVRPERGAGRPSVHGNLTWLLSQGLTVNQIAYSLGTDDETIRCVLADPDTPMSPSTQRLLSSLSSHQVARINNLVAVDDFKERIQLLTLDGCLVEDIERTLDLRPGALRMHLPVWVDVTTGPGMAYGLTIEQVDSPRVPAALTWGRLQSLETMGWGRTDVEAVIGPDLPDDAEGLIDRGVAQDVVVYWRSYSSRLNPLGTELAQRRRSEGVRAPADWDPPDALLWWPPSELRHLLDLAPDELVCGPSPVRR